MTGVIAAGCLVAAAVTVGWPVNPARARWRRLGFTGPRAGRAHRAWAAIVHCGRSPSPWVPVAGAAGSGLVAVVAGGPVAGAVAAAYCFVGVRTLGRRLRAREAAARRVLALDGIGALAADLRAGLLHPAPGPTLSTVDEIAVRVTAATRLAEVTGAPLADLLDRIEADARSADQAGATAAAQSAGARTTAVLLACLPAAGIGLGYAIGADPLHVLLRTPVGAACALVALALQLGGVAWSARLARPEAIA